MRQSGACVSTFPPLGIVFCPFPPRQQLTAVMISPNRVLNPSAPSSLPGACVPATAGTHAELLVSVNNVQIASKEDVFNCEWLCLWVWYWVIPVVTHTMSFGRWMKGLCPISFRMMNNLLVVSKIPVVIMSTCCSRRVEMAVIYYLVYMYQVSGWMVKTQLCKLCYF